MKENYFNFQKIENNLDNQIISSPELNINNIINNLITDPTQTLKINEDPDLIQEVPIKFGNFNSNSNFRKKANNLYQFKNKLNNTYHNNTTANFSGLLNSYDGKINLNNDYFDYNSQPRKTHEIYPNYKFIDYNDLFNDKGSTSIDIYDNRKTESKYSSLSENKNQIINRMANNPKYGFTIFTENNIPNINYSNYSPIDKSKLFQKPDKSYLTNYFTDLDSFLNFSRYSNGGINNNLQNKTIERQNRFINNKSNSNYNLNTVNWTNFQHKLQTNGINPNINININNQIGNINVNLNTNLNSNSNMKKIKKSPNISKNRKKSRKKEDQRLTVGQRSINNINKNPFQKNLKQNNTQEIKNKNIKKENNLQNTEFAKVTKISSIHRKLPNKINKTVNNNINNTLLNNKDSNNSSNVIDNPIKNNNPIINNTNEENKKLLNNINNETTKQIVKKQVPIISHQIENQQKKIQVINDIQIQEENPINNKLRNSLTNEEVNIDIPPQKTIPSSSIKQHSKYRTDTNTIVTRSNNNSQYTNQNQILDNQNSILENKNIITDNQNQISDEQNENISQNEIPQNKNKTNNQKKSGNKKQNNNTKIKKVKKQTKKEVSNDVNKEQSVIKNGVNIKYSDFDGSGYVKNYGGVTRPGKDIFGKIKINQDRLICITNINGVKDFNIFGVFDGHGPEGHFVSEYISNFLPSQIVNHPEIKNLSDPEEIYQKFKENNCRIIFQAFLDSDKILESVDFSAIESGTTCCLIIHIGKHIMCANTGDSRAIVTYDESKEDSDSNKLNYLKVTPLSIDYKPELPEETERIIKSGGVIEPMTDEYGEFIGPLRVWAKDEDYPGLAMSRSIGDLRGKTVGIIPDPGIYEYDLNKTTKYIIICSDGVWEYLNNEQVKDLGKKFYLENDASALCHNLVSESFNQWEIRDQFADDITAVVVFF